MCAALVTLLNALFDETRRDADELRAKANLCACNLQIESLNVSFDVAFAYKIWLCAGEVGRQLDAEQILQLVGF